VEKLAELVQAKVEGKELVSPPPADEPKVINLMDALKKSLAKAKQSGDKPTRHRAVPTSRKTASPGRIVKRVNRVAERI